MQRLAAQAGLPMVHEAGDAHPFADGYYRILDYAKDAGEITRLRDVYDFGVASARAAGVAHLATIQLVDRDGARELSVAFRDASGATTEQFRVRTRQYIEQALSLLGLQRSSHELTLQLRDFLRAARDAHKARSASE